MLPSRSILIRFTVSFVVLYAAMLLPWPGLKEYYPQVFRGMTRVFFETETGRCVVRVPTTLPPGSRLDVPILLANPQHPNANGQVPFQLLGLDSRSMGWVPTALLVALVLASPVAWRRRVLALLVGLLVLHIYIVFCIACYLWNEKAYFEILTLTTFWREVTAGLVETCVTQMGASFVVPVLIWAALILRRSPTFSSIPPESPCPRA